jgi:hypothetical protein
MAALRDLTFEDFVELWREPRMAVASFSCYQL